MPCSLLSLFFHTTGKIYPSSDQPLTLHAVFKDGSEVAGESHIADHPDMIDHVYVTIPWMMKHRKPAVE